MTICAPRFAVLLAGLSLCLTLAEPARGKCQFKKVGGLFNSGVGGTDAFVDSDSGKAIKVTHIGDPNDPLNVNPPVSIENYDGKKKVIDYTSYSDAVRQCSVREGFWPDWFPEPAPKATAAHLNGAVPIVTASSDLDGGDFDGDGDVDLVGIRFFQGASVTLGNPDGTFPTVGVVYPTGPGPETLLLADLNGDGRKDLLVADSGNFNTDTGKLAVLLGIGNGTFAPSVGYQAGVAPRAVTVGDFNGDGRVDAAVASIGSLGAPNLPANSGRVAVLLGNGNGTFQEASLLQAGEAPVSIVATDISGDGKLDLAVANDGSDSVSLFIGNGDGTFKAAVNTAVGSRPSFLGSADFNGDGRADLAVLHGETATISMWMNNGSGGFTSAGRYLSGSSIASFAIADSPEDERPTILSPDRSGGRFLLLGVDRAGTLAAPPSYPVGRGPGGIAAADFDGNQQLDLAVASSDGVSLILNPRPRQFPQPTPRPAIAGSVTRANALAAGDFNGDALADLAVAENGVSVLAGNGNGTFRAPVNVGAATSPRYMRAADLNGDSRLDLIVVEDVRPRGNVAVHLAAAGGSFARTAYPVGVSPRSVVAADFNGDGRPDLAVANFGDLTAPAGVSLLLANAAGGFGAAATLDAGLSINTVAAGDFNGDGRMDLAAAGQLAGTPNFVFGVRMLLGNGAGGFQALPDLATNFGPADLAAVDFNGDGLLDLAVSHCCGTTDMSMLLGNGDGRFRSIRFPGGASPFAIAAGDFDRDGNLDLAVTNSPVAARSGTASILDFDLHSADHVSAASGSPGVQAPDSIISAFGARLSTETAAASSPDWPALLGGTRVQVRDSTGAERDAGIAFTSAGQVNYHMPAETAEGPATVTITASDGRRVSTEVEIVRIASGLFQATPGGLAAAWVIRVKADGQQLLEPVVQLNNVNQIVAAPIDLGDASDTMVLQLFGTGLRRRLSASDVRVLINGVDGTVHYAGAQGQFPGLDQINVEIPKSLRGAGLVNVVMQVEDLKANVVQIRIR